MPLLENPDDLLPLADPQRLGLPYARRTLTRYIANGRFPKPIKIGGRLFIRRETLNDYKAALIRCGDPGAALRLLEAEGASHAND